MSKLNEIQNAIRRIDGGAYQKLMDEYVYKRFGYKNFVAYGSHTGTNKTTKGVPDSYTYTDNNKYTYLMYGTPAAAPYSKVKSDIESCLNVIEKDSGLVNVEKIICCHTSSNFSPAQTANLRALSDKVEIISIDELSLDLHQRYPQLAKEHLGISVDTNQILDVDDFIAINRNERFSTPLTTQIVDRENEIEEVMRMLETNNAVLVFGAPGSGKTRLVLEVARQYSYAHSCNVKVIRSNGAPLYDAIPSYFSDIQQYLVIVDDANQLSALDYLFDFINRASNKTSIKLLLTVRDYAKDIVLQKSNHFAAFTVFRLKRCNKETISTILKEQFGIINNKYLDQINTIAKGNIRVAIMSAIKAKNGNYSDIQDVSSIYQAYFAEALSGLTERELLIASYLAYFDSMEFSAENIITAYLIDKGIEGNELLSVSLKLHTREIADLYERQAVRFAQQNLQDYLLYHSICVSKELSISDIVLETFNYSPTRAVYAFNTILGIFRSTITYKFMSAQVIEVWQKMKERPFEERLSFIKAFAQLLKNEALTFINEEIERMPEEHEDFINYEFRNNDFSQGRRRTLLGILPNFKHGKEFADAITLFLKLLNRNSKKPDDFFYVLTRELCVDPDSHHYRYCAELTLLQRLVDEYTSDPKDSVAVCILVYCKSLLAFEFSEATSNEDYSVTYSRFEYSNCESAYDLRARCISAIFTVYKNSRHRRNAGKVLFGYYPTDKLDKHDLVVNDIRRVARSLSSIASPYDINNCILVEHYSSFAGRVGLSTDIFPDFTNQNPSFTLLRTICEDWLGEDDYNKAENVYNKKIRNLWVGMSKEDKEDFFFNLSQDFLHTTLSWNICMGLTAILTAPMIKAELCSCIEMYCKHNTPFTVNINTVVSHLVNNIGFRQARAILEKQEFAEKQRWLSCLFDFITTEEFGEAERAEIFNPELLLHNGRYHALSAQTIYRLNEKYPGIFVDYSIMLSRQNNSARLLSEFLNGFLHAVDGAANKLCELFHDKQVELEKLYCLAFSSKHFDFEGNLLMAIAERNTSFVCFLFSNVAGGNVHSQHVRAIKRLWESEKSNDIVNAVVDSTIRNGRTLYSVEAILFDTSGNNQRQANRQDSWIKRYIKENISDLDRCTFLFNNLLDELPQEHRLEYLFYACQRGCPFPVFSEIRLFPSMTSWSGSEIPILEKKQRVVLELRDRLNAVESTFEHRAFLNSEAVAFKQRISEVGLHEFLKRPLD